jgi:Ca-activated chloride channel family protein
MGRFGTISLFLAGLIVGQAPGQQPSVFRSTTDNVPVFVTVTDKSGRLVPDLTRDDFQLSDGGRPQALTVFDNSPQPVRLIVLIDVSGSMSGNLRLLRESAHELFIRLRDDDKVRVGTFGNEITISPEFTHDEAALERALPTDIPASARTPLWKAVDDAMTQLEQADGRRVIAVLSDGKDTDPMAGKKFLTPIDISDRALREDVMIYGVGMHSRGPMGAPGMGGVNIQQAIVGGFPDPSLGTVALDSGGGYFEIRPRDDLGAAFARVADELHHQYLLGFTPPARDGKQHKIEVRTRNKDLKVRARKAYQAPKG